ncbi:glycosyltransferase family 2 protein [Salinicola peritrichatus]|uniref:glycosyltransferase family 2 protein n=1 Tax=Salinicola peritrichatus TaxID=1267424 RepID=UPI0013A67518|nr:glycosyltransferase family 2 protein [Salinicola peritrichatus]
MFEFIMEHDQPRAAVRVYFDTGKGFHDEQSVFMPLRRGKMTKRICFIPYGTRAIRLDPLESEGCFAITHLRLVWLRPRFAYDRMSRRLCSAHPQYRDLSSRVIIQSLKREACENGLSWKKLAIAHYEETFMHCAPESNYHYWLEHVEPLREPSARQVVAHLAQLSQQPLISVLLPIHVASSEWLTACVESVREQRYQNWQLCIADASGSREIHAVVERLATRDERIQIASCEPQGRAMAGNTALAMANGDYIALLSPGDQLAPNALYHVVETLGRHPEAEMLYSDEDRLNSENRRYDPHFKPQWNPDLLLTQNYISHLTVYRVSRLRRIGGFRKGFEGSQDYDLLLRFTQGLTARQIRHIPFVLYHWREGEQDCSLEVGQHALREHLAVFAPGAEVIPERVSNSYRVQWPLPEPTPLVSLLIPTRDRVEILRPCVDAILARTDYPNFELLILDNQSSCPETLTYMAQVADDPRVSVLRWDQPFNYSAINNFGARQARGSILGLVNNDIEPINDDWLSEMVRQVCRPEIGCVGAKLYYPNGTVQHGGVILGVGGIAGHAHRFFPRNHSGYRHRLNLVQNLSAVTAACLLVRKSVFKEVNGLNEEHLSVAYNDVDLCLKVREAGYRNLWTPYAELYHHESVSRGADDNPQKRARAEREVTYMRTTWGSKLDSDPAYNPNLTLVYEDFSLR